MFLLNMRFEELILSFFDGISNANYDLIIWIIQFLFIAFWIVVLGWVWVDAGERSTHKYTRLGSIALVGILNIFGLIIYLLIRPRQTIQEIYWADLERRYLKYETSELKDCPNCKYSLAPGYNACPRCGWDIKKQCPSCQVWIDKSFKYCPYCKNSFVQPTPVEVVTSPTVMQEEVAKTQEEAISVVENKQTKYVVKTSLISKVKGDVLAFVKKVGDSVVNRSTKKELKVKKQISSQNQNIEKKREVVSRKEKKKNKKKRNRR